MSESKMIPETNKIICADCLSVMKDWDDNCVDLVLTDPPYGIGEAKKRNESRSKLAQSRAYPIESWDDEPPAQEDFDEIRRIGKNQIIFGGNHFSDKLPQSPCWLVWNKDNGQNDFADCELLWTSFGSAVRYFKWRWHGMIQEVGAGFTQAKEIRYHRNQKPLGLLAQIIERYSCENTVILDCYSGSGAICVAAKMLGRRYIGIDISEKYCEIARQRLEAVDTGVPVKERQKGQIPLFT